MSDEITGAGKGGRRAPGDGDGTRGGEGSRGPIDRSRSSGGDLSSRCGTGFGAPLDAWVGDQPWSTGPAVRVSGPRSSQHGQTLRTIKMANDYMEPELRVGETLCIQPVASLDEAEVYFFEVNDAYQVARLERRDDGTIRIHPSNDDYDALCISDPEADLTIYGKVWGRMQWM